MVFFQKCFKKQETQNRSSKKNNIKNFRVILKIYRISKLTKNDRMVTLEAYEK